MFSFQPAGERGARIRCWNVLLLLCFWGLVGPVQTLWCGPRAAWAAGAARPPSSPPAEQPDPYVAALDPRTWKQKLPGGLRVWPQTPQTLPLLVKAVSGGPEPEWGHTRGISEDGPPVRPVCELVRVLRWSPELMSVLTGQRGSEADPLMCREEVQHRRLRSSSPGTW